MAIQSLLKIGIPGIQGKLGYIRINKIAPKKEDQKLQLILPVFRLAFDATPEELEKQTH